MASQSSATRTKQPTTPCQPEFVNITRIQPGRYMIEAHGRVFWIEKVRDLRLWDLRESSTDGWINDFGSYAEAKVALRQLLAAQAQVP